MLAVPIRPIKTSVAASIFRVTNIMGKPPPTKAMTAGLALPRACAVWMKPINDALADAWNRDRGEQAGRECDATARLRRFANMRRPRSTGP